MKTLPSLVRIGGALVVATAMSMSVSGCATPVGVSVAPTYVAPGPGWYWAHHGYYGWGWYHPVYGWHRGWA